MCNAGKWMYRSVSGGPEGGATGAREQWIFDEFWRKYPEWDSPFPLARPADQHKVIIA